MRGLIGWLAMIAFAVAAPLPAFASQLAPMNCDMSLDGHGTGGPAAVDCDPSCLAPGGSCYNCPAIKGTGPAPRFAGVGAALPPIALPVAQFSGIQGRPEPPPPRNAIS
jgi:hypothetical protein